ncbi:SagB family peptide dehydrogenase [Streptomyces sp. NPDC001833]|uniref:SagB family peptide dehydrogenase n=1 Tax=Streptomyces sp. NPDC001833 TaxID=3154658 RepID=UPI0033168451
MVREILRLRPGVTATNAAIGRTLLHHGPELRGMATGTLTPGQSAALELLARGDHTTDDLVTASSTADGWPGLVNLHALLDVLRAGNWLCRTLVDADKPLLTLAPCRPPDTEQRPMPVDASAGRRSGKYPEPANAAFVMSRFAVLRRAGTEMLLESPRARVVAAVSEPSILALLGRLTGPTPRPQAVEGRGPWAPAVFDALVSEGFIVPVDSQEDTDFRWLAWTPHELWFHSRSASPSAVEVLSEHGEDWGGTSWAEGRFPPLPAHPEVSGKRTQLPVPDLDRLMAEDPTFQAVLERTRSVRRHDHQHPLDAVRLGELLFRAARTRGVRRHRMVDLLDRPYPSGGALHELQVYVLSIGVDGIPKGLHRYDGLSHTLEQAASYTPQVRLLAEYARGAAAMDGLPQAVLVITARFGRVMWKYQSMAYALVLKNAGVLMAYLYLVATSIGLAPCALGGGEADLFARATGLDFFTESAVGAFVLGSAPSGNGPSCEPSGQ